jgi:hypothetical protein
MVGWMVIRMVGSWAVMKGPSMDDWWVALLGHVMVGMLEMLTAAQTVERTIERWLPGRLHGRLTERLR